MPAKLLVFGARGQVARALADVTSFDVELSGRDRLDLGAPSSDLAADIAGVIAAARPAAVINAAAYTAVDKAETDLETARRVNREAPAAMARACADADVPFVHISTDYVFDGETGAPYDETSPRHPINAYGLTKAEGEIELEALAGQGARLAIVRSAWVFTSDGEGFFKTMLRLARERDAVSVVEDQRSNPTPAFACAAATVTLARALLDRDKLAEGLFHAAGAQSMTRADFAEAIFAGLAARGARRPRLARVTSDAFPLPARRPLDTRLVSAKLEAATDWRAPDVGAALSQYLDRVEGLAR
jgi:dTDP-4-dehydrorhamnose reductase